MVLTATARVFTIHTLALLRRRPMVTRPEEFANLPYHADLVGFRAEDGFPLDGLLYSPKAGAPTAVVLVHGKTCNFLGGPSRFLPLPLARAGYASFAVNMRVHSLGYSRGDAPFENFDNFAAFLGRLAERPGWWDEHVGRARIPTLLLYADRESHAAEWEEKFRDVIKTPRKELVCIRNAEHMYLGHEDEVADAVISFPKKYTV
jgi:hypothetical protein